MSSAVPERGSGRGNQYTNAETDEDEMDAATSQDQVRGGGGGSVSGGGQLQGGRQLQGGSGGEGREGSGGNLDEMDTDSIYQDDEGAEYVFPGIKIL